LELAEGDAGRALKPFEPASKAERRLVADPWGRAALKANQARLRERAFRIALQQYPNDAHAKVG
jgi:hypothetical protein